MRKSFLQELSFLSEYHGTIKSINLCLLIALVSKNVVVTPRYQYCDSFLANLPWDLNFSDCLLLIFLVLLFFITDFNLKTTSLLSVLLIEINLLFTFRGLNLVLNHNHNVPDFSLSIESVLYTCINSVESDLKSIVC